MKKARALSQLLAKVPYFVAQFVVSKMAQGIFTVGGACFVYYVFGFSWLVFGAWVIGIALCGERFFRERRLVLNRPDWNDVLIALVLVAIATPVFLWSVYTIPFQMAEDETTNIDFEKTWTDSGVDDVFGLSPYFGFPYLPYLILGYLGKLLGGVGLYHQRLLHGADAILVVVSSFVFYRVLRLRRMLAAIAALFLCFNHSFVVFSRFAFRDNGAVLIEILSLAALFMGLKQKCPFATYVGGILAGVGWYLYYPARVTMPIWLLFMVVLAIKPRKILPIPDLFKLSAISLFGLALTVAPLVAANIRQPYAAAESRHFMSQTCLLLPLGRNVEKGWSDSKSELEGVVRNVVGTLTAFNSDHVDEGNQYFNPGHGFSDPITGLVLWVGLIWLFARKRDKPEVLLITSGMFLQLFLFAFVVNKAPNYGRLLVILPFVS
jgi:hypothetical protein